MVTVLGTELVAGRTCGSCNVCCVDLTIDDRELQKLQGFRCHNAQSDNSCAIYETRPQSCRTFYCGWRLLNWVREPLRPDASGVLVRLEKLGKRGKSPEFGVVFTLLNRAALKADGLAETMAAAIAANVPTFLHVPGPPGYTAGQAQLNDVLRQAVMTRNKRGLLETLAKAYEIGLRGDTQPIVVIPRGAGGG